MLSRAEFHRQFDDWHASAWRWECQGVYREPREEEPMRRFLRGESDLAWFADWLARVRTWTSAGQRIGRVRMLTDPLTDYLRFELFITPPAVDAGERIRFLRAAQADELDLPREDFWMFDDERVVRMTFGQQGVSGAELITEPGTVARYRTWRSAAERASVPLAELRPRV